MTRQEAKQAVITAKAARDEAARVLREATKAECDANARYHAVMSDRTRFKAAVTQAARATREAAFAATVAATAAKRKAEADHYDAVDAARALDSVIA